MFKGLRILQVDDHPLYREGVRNRLLQHPHIVAVEEAASAEAALEKLSLETFDVIIADYRLPGKSGVWLLQQVRLVNPSLPFVILSNFQDPGMVSEALQFGAHGYLLKTASGDEVLQAIFAVLEGGTYLQADLQNAPPSTTDGLTGKERETLQLLLAGHTLQQVADKLVVSVNTVKTHLRGLYLKFAVTNRSDLVLRALSQGYTAHDS
jgi:DNA-binding NarL/FixJ family response regulator